jgi:hypothetical protein
MRAWLPAALKLLLHRIVHGHLAIMGLPETPATH